MKEKAPVQKELRELTGFDHIQIWTLRFSAVLGGVTIPLVFYTIDHPSFPTKPVVCLVQLLEIPALGLVFAEDLRKRLKREKKIR